MQNLDFTSPLPGVQGRDNSLAELDALDVDNLLSTFGCGFAGDMAVMHAF